MIPPEDLKVESLGWEHPGGQHVGVPRGVKVTHIPTETVAICKTARSQFTNRKIAVDMILAAITHPDFD